jgi:hypothetical protein
VKFPGPLLLTVSRIPVPIGTRHFLIPASQSTATLIASDSG